jgi:hypothetical protein
MPTIWVTMKPTRQGSLSPPPWPEEEEAMAEVENGRGWAGEWGLKLWIGGGGNQARVVRFELHGGGRFRIGEFFYGGLAWMRFTVAGDEELKWRRIFMDGAACRWAYLSEILHF